MLVTVFWLSLVALAYTYVGYPVLIACLARVRPRPVRRAAIRPSVTLVVIAHNEAARIAQRLENCLALEYPADRLAVVVVSDGSTDDTVDVARRYESRGVRVIAFPLRRGKPSVLNDVIPTCDGELVVLADARQTFASDALSALVESFHDERVGAVSGELVLRPGATTVGRGVGFYWSYEKLIRRSESRVDSTVGVTGAIWAARRALIRPIPPDTILDDVYLPLSIVRQGHRVLFEPRALAYDDPVSTARQEFTRKVRTIAGTLQLLVRERWLWSPRRNRLWFQTLSHKAFRLTSPFLLVALLLTNIPLASTTVFYASTLLAQVTLYVMALAAAILPGAPPRFLAVPYAFVLLNVTTIWGVLGYVSGRQTVTWRKPDEPAVGRRLMSHDTQAVGPAPGPPSA
jgi:poly-beta-1,6-N-acetyl-D-glucosamine synthase